MDNLDRQQIDELIENSVASNHFSGSLVISHQSDYNYEKHMGIANRSWQTQITDETKFDIASLNKSFIAALILIAVEEGKLALNDKLVDLLSSYNYSGSFNSEITIHHMLSHTSGLPDYDQVALSLKANGFRKFKRLHFSSSSDYIDYISNVPSVALPDKQFHYSNFAYHLLPIILEDLYELSFNEILQEKICTPIGLQKTVSFSDNAQVINQLAEGYQYDEKQDSWQLMDFIDLTLGRRIFSTANDLNKWGLALSTGMVLNKSSLNKMTTNHLSGITDNMGYGYGIVPYSKDDHFMMGDLGIDKPYLIHGGSTDGYKSMLVIINKGEWVVSLTVNSGKRTNEMELIQKIVKQIISKS